MTATVATLRDLNNRYGPVLPTGRVPVIVCAGCLKRHSGDLARYWAPRETEHFLCSQCDHETWVRFALPYPDVAVLPLAQRYTLPESAPAMREP